MGLRTEGGSTPSPERRAIRSGAGASGSLLLPRLLSAAADETLRLRRGRSLTHRRLLHEDDLMEKPLRHLRAEDRLVQCHRPGLFILNISYFYFRHVPLKLIYFFAAASACFFTLPRFALWISTNPSGLPGTDPFTKTRFSSGRTSITSRPSAVTRSLPMCPGIPLFFQTREGKELAPIDPGRRWNIEPCVAGPPAK